MTRQRHSKRIMSTAPGDRKRAAWMVAIGLVSVLVMLDNAPRVDAQSQPCTPSTPPPGPPGPPGWGKVFGADRLPLNGTTTLTFRLANGHCSAGLSGITFTDSLPPGLIIATPNGLSNVGNSCGGTITAIAGSSTVSLVGGFLFPESFGDFLSSCGFSVNVTGTSAGTKDNTTGVVMSSAGPGGTASATLVVVAPPAIAKAFGAASIPLNGTTTLSFILSNSNPGTALTGVGFTDTLPPGLVLAAPNGLVGSCGGTITAIAASSSITMSGGALAAGGSCAFSVDVRGTVVGDQVNTSGSVTSTEGGLGNTASAVLVVAAAAIPTLGFWAFALLGMLLAAAALRVLRARRI
jgi:hypothetical protein